MKKLVLLLLCAPLSLFAQKNVLTWTEPATALPYGFNVYRSVQTGSTCDPFTAPSWSKLQGSINAATLTWNDTAITPGTTYCYAVTAYNTTTVAESAPSNVIAVAVPLAAGGGSGAPPPPVNNTPPSPTGLTGSYSPN